MNQELKPIPCRKCNTAHIYTEGSPWVYVMCKCKIRTERCQSEKEAVRIWNNHFKSKQGELWG